jgi:hypothetical protein
LLPSNAILSVVSFTIDNASFFSPPSDDDDKDDEDNKEGTFTTTSIAPVAIAS